MRLALQLIDLDGGEVVKTFALPLSVLKSLADGNEIVVKYIGWDLRQGCLGSTILPETVMTGDPDDAWTPAGKLSVTLRDDVDDKSNPGFLPYMTYEDRKKAGIVR